MRSTGPRYVSGAKADPIERPAGGLGSSEEITVVGPAESSQNGHPRRIRLEQISNRSSKTLHGFVGRMVEPGAHGITDGPISYENMPNNTHEPRISLAERHTKSFASCTAQAQTSSGERRTCSTAFSKSTYNATSTSSPSAGTVSAVCERHSPGSSVSVSHRPSISVTSSIAHDQARRRLAAPL